MRGRKGVRSQPASHLQTIAHGFGCTAPPGEFAKIKKNLVIKWSAGRNYKEATKKTPAI